jgi:hypothetical protein
MYNKIVAQNSKVRRDISKENIFMRWTLQEKLFIILPTVQVLLNSCILVLDAAPCPQQKRLLLMYPKMV